MTNSTPDLAVSFAGINLKNPIIAASGTFGYGVEFEDIVHLDRLGGLVVKGLSKEPMTGNPPPRLYETAAGMLNAIGLQNIGASAFLTEKLPALRAKKKRVVVFANVFGYTRADYERTIEILNQGEGIAAYEINVSCPNTAHGGIQFGSDPLLLDEVVRTARRGSSRPVIVKLPPNVTSIAQMAYVAQEAGADAISLVEHVFSHGDRCGNTPPQNCECHGWPFRPSHQADRIAHGVRRGARGKNSGDWHGRNYNASRHRGIHAGRSDCRAGRNRQLPARSGGNGNAGGGTHQLLPRAPHRLG